MTKLVVKILAVLGAVLLFAVGGGLLWMAASLFQFLPPLSANNLDHSHYMVQVGSLSISGGWMFGLLGLLLLVGCILVSLAVFIVRSIVRPTLSN